jgi:hypothetical protein
LGVTSSFMGGRRPGEGSDCGLVRVGGQRMGEVVPYLPTIGKCSWARPWAVGEDLGANK